jgi:hypothetical protein
MMAAPPSAVQTREALMRLWLHEQCRVFGDRLVSREDTEYFTQMLVSGVGGGGLQGTRTNRMVVSEGLLALGCGSGARARGGERGGGGARLFAPCGGASCSLCWWQGRCRCCQATLT